MTRLRKMMLEELQRRNYSENTTRSYIRTIEDFAQRFNLPPDRLGPQHIREYRAELFQKRKLSPSSVAIRLAALRFFYTKTLSKTWSIVETPYPKKALRMPPTLSQEEVAQLIDAARTPNHRTLLMTLYATGIRNAELARLKVSDIDSKRMVIHIQGGKGRRDRLTNYWNAKPQSRCEAYVQDASGKASLHIVKEMVTETVGRSVQLRALELVANSTAVWFHRVMTSL